MQRAVIASLFLGPTEINTVNNDLIKFTNLIGPRSNENVTVGLYEGNCKTVVPQDNLLTIDTIQSPFSYTVEVDQSKINQDESNLITCIDGNGSECFEGEIEFCTEITATDDSDLIHHRFTGFKWGFASSQTTFITSSIDVLDNGYFSESLSICQCKNFICVDPKPVLWEDTRKKSLRANKKSANITSQIRLSACIQAPIIRDNKESMLEITNFNTKISAGSIEEANYVEYNPVLLGDDEWISSMFTSVQVEEGGGSVMFVTPVIAQFYIARHNPISVTGNGFFKHPFQDEELYMGKFGMNVSIFETIQEPEPAILKAPPEVVICQCENFKCMSFPKSVELNNDLYLCVIAFNFEQPDLEITNLSIKMFAGTIGLSDYVDVNPVWFGAENFMTDSFTDIERKSNNLLMIRTTVDEKFYRQDHERVEITGNVYIEEIDWLNSFDFSFSIQPIERNCFQQLYDIFIEALEGWFGP